MNRLICLVMLALIVFSAGITLAEFTAYNDCSWKDTHPLIGNATGYGIGNSFTGQTSGLLKDDVTGLDTSVTVTFTQSGGVTNEPSTNGGGTHMSTDPGTDAHSVFDGKVDMIGVIYYGSPGWYVDVTFTGLNPDLKYEFVTTANRDDPGYTSRLSVFSILGADSYVNASTNGTVISPDGVSTKFNTGYNQVNGYVARWTNIVPGADGSFTIRATHAPEAESGYKAYAFSAFMLKEIGGPSFNIDPEPTNVTAKNVILMIGDGMGFKHIEATRNYVGHQLAMETLPLHLACTTYPSGGGYNSVLASTNFNYLNEGFTDSAAAATALATGNKTASGRIGVNASGTSRLKSITEHVSAFSKARGVVTTVPFSHATPAGFGAHNTDRGNVTAIAREMIMGLGNGTGAWGNTPTLDVIIGGGRGTGYIGSTEYNALKNGTTGQGWTFVDRQTGVDGGQAILNASQSATKLFGLFGDGGEDLPYRLADGSGYTLENPNLAEMSIAAINVLSKDPDGFFLMIEGGAIDHGAHSNNINVVIGEVIDFDDAVAAVINWVNTNDPDWSETLLIVTADHETGYLTKGSGILPNVPLGNPGPGKLPNSTHIAWNSGNHTNSPVPVFAKGAGTTTLEFYANKHDLLYDIDYLNNIDIFKTICRVMTNPKTLAEARSAENNEVLSIYNAVVTASYDDAFWVERADRSAGIKVISTARPSKGKKVDIIGRIVKENREVAILATSVIDAGVRNILPPVGITGKIAAEFDKNGATAQGMLVKIAGTATAVTRNANNKVDGYFLDDGAGLPGNGINKGLYVMLDPNGDTTDSIIGTFVDETGPLTTVEINGSPLPAIRGEVKAPVNFTAYNDCSVAEGDPTYNITTYTVGDSNQCLKDYTTGLDLPVRVSMTDVSNYHYYPYIGANCNPGTDANNVFGGIVSLAGSIPYISTGASWMELVISGLDPNGRYEFVTTANRADSAYTTRTTKFSLLDAVSFTNSSTLGSTFSGPSDPTVTFCTGYNTVKGYVARWTNIRPSAAGTFRVRAESPTGITQSYAFSAFKLQRLQ